MGNSFSGQTFTCNYEEIWRTSGFISVGKITESWCQNNTKVIIYVVKKTVRSKHEMKHSKEDSVVLSGTFLMSCYQYVLQWKWLIEDIRTFPSLLLTWHKGSICSLLVLHLSFSPPKISGVEHKRKSLIVEGKRWTAALLVLVQNWGGRVISGLYFIIANNSRMCLCVVTYRDISSQTLQKC